LKNVRGAKRLKKKKAFGLKGGLKIAIYSKPAKPGHM
jgi:hypothetical protein